MPRWSPDGQELLFVRDDGNVRALVVINADGSRERILLRVAESIVWPGWCPDGRRIVFTLTREDNEDLYAVDVATGTMVRLTDDPARDTAPACGRDGDVIFASGRAGPLNLYRVRIP